MGTIFLDEIGDMPFEIQARLLEFYNLEGAPRFGGREQIKIDVRIISAANKNLIDAINQGAFEDDLYYELNVINIDLPPLRNRERMYYLWLTILAKIFKRFKKI